MAHSSETLIGRDAELEELAGALGVVPGGPVRGGTVLLSGDAGVGKTRLLVELRDRARAGDWLVLAGHCLDFGESALAYLPFSEVLGRLAAELPDLVDEVAGRHPALARLQPGRRLISAQGAEGGESDGALDRADLFEAVHGLLEAAADLRPVLLVIEDVHWADRSTRDLLGFLFTRPFAGQVSLVASYRSDDLHRRHPLRQQVAEWARIRGVDRIALEPLPDTSVRALVAELAGSDDAPLDEMRVRDIVRRADGNAFFVEELVASSAGPDRWVPDDLRELLLVRLDRLDDVARQVVRAASVAGRRVGHELLAAVAGLDDGAFDAAVRQAVEMNVLVGRNAGYEFRHALLGEAVYDDLLPGERVGLHARFAEALVAGAPGTAAELARHARRAHDHDTATRAAIDAAQEAYAVGGPEEAAHHYQQALELLEDPDRCARLGLDRAKVAASAAFALVHSGHGERAAALLRDQLDRVPADAPDSWRARLHTAYATVLLPLESEQEPLVQAAKAVELAGDGVLRAKALSVLARALAQADRFEEAQAAGVEALALAETHDHQTLAAEIVTTLSALKKAGPREALADALSSAVERARTTGALESELRARFLLGIAHMEAGEWADAVRWFRSALERGTAVGQPWAPYCVESRWQLAAISFVTGDWDQVLELTAPADAPDVPEVPRGLLTSVRLAVPLHRGEDVEVDLAALRPLWEREGAVTIHAAGLQVQAAGLRGDATAALAVYDDATDVLGRLWHPFFGARVRLAALTVEAICRTLPTVPALERTGWVEHVRRLRDDGVATAAKNSEPPSTWGLEGRAWSSRLEAEALRARWLAGVDEPAQAELVAAWTACEEAFAELGHVHELARVRATSSGLHRALGEAAEARRLGDLARETAHRLGAQPLLDELVEIGSTARATGPLSDTLTPREAEVLALVAEGRSNGEIGRHLYISTKTVSVHVSNILGKLGAATRTEAAAIARRRGLIA